MSVNTPTERLARAGVVLPTGTLRRRLGQSIWLLLLLETWTRPGEAYACSGEPLQASRMAAALGIGERQARRDLQRLRKAGHVELQNTGRGFKIRIYGNPLGAQSRA